MKNSIFRKSSYRQKTFKKKKKKLYGTRVPCNILQVNSIFIKSSFSLKLDFFKKLNFKTGVFCQIISEQRHFATCFGRNRQMLILANWDEKHSWVTVYSIWIHVIESILGLSATYAFSFKSDLLISVIDFAGLFILIFKI